MADATSLSPWQNLAAKQAEWKAGGATQAGAPAASPASEGPSLPLIEVDKDTFYPALEAAGDALVGAFVAAYPSGLSDLT